MARRRDKRNGPAVAKAPVENNEADDEGRDEESPPPSPEKENSQDEVETETNGKVDKTAKKGKKLKSKKDDGEFEVDQIVGMEVNKRWRCPVRFRVRWVGFGEKDDTWVSVDNLSCDNFVQDFLQISGRKSEYEKVMESIKQQTEQVDSYRESLRRKSAKIDYFNEESDEEILATNSTRTRKTRPPELFDPADARPQLLKLKRKPKSFGVSLAQARAQQAGREYEVVLIVDHRVVGRFTEYKVRWKGLASSHDSWVPEANLTCPKLIANYHKSISDTPEQEYEVAGIIDSREVNGVISYKVRWKGFSPKYDSWLPKDDMSCPDMVAKFESALDKLNKKEDWVVKKILNRRERNGGVEFLVSWQGFESKYDTWEPEDNLKSCQDKVDNYYAKVEQRKSKKNKRRAGDSSDSDNEKEQEEEEKVEQDSEEEKEEEVLVKNKRSSTGKSLSTKSKKQSAGSDSDEEEEVVVAVGKKKRSSTSKSPSTKTKKRSNGDSSGSDQEKDEEEEVVVKKRRSSSGKATSSKTTKSTGGRSASPPSKGSRQRRITLPVSYEEDDASDE